MSVAAVFTKKFDMQKKLNKYRKSGAQKNVVDIKEMTVLIRDAIVSFESDPHSTKFHQTMIDRCKGGDTLAQSYIKQYMQYIMHTYVVKDYTHFEAISEIYKYLYGLDVIDDIYNGPKTEEIRVNDFDDIYQVIAGVSHKIKGLQFRDRKAVEHLISRMTMHEGKEINKASPSIEAELFDGSRLTASIPPETSAPSFVLRKHNTIAFDTKTLKEKGTIDDQMVKLLSLLIKGRANIIIIGGTNTGKTHTLKWLVDFINPGYKLATLERVRELKLKAHYANVREVNEYLELPRLGRTMAKQFETLLRYSPDIIIVGETRGSEIVQMMQANTSGHEGSIGTAHATSYRDFINRALYMQSQDGAIRSPEYALREVCMAFDVVVMLKRYDNGDRKIAEIAFLDYDEDTKREKFTMLSNYTKGDFKYYPQQDASFMQKILPRFEQNNVELSDMREAGIIV